MHILLIAPYFGGSHRAWAEGYAQHSRHDVQLLTLPARFWKWRMQGGALTLAEQALTLRTMPDLLLVTDMLHLPAFLGLTRRRYADVPVALYCHENQLTYPLQPGEKRDLSYAMINWLSMLTADAVFFNSAYHLDSWFDELPRLLKHFPDYTHLHRVPEVRARSSVLHVGCDLARLDQAQNTVHARSVPLILWNQRWEYDKDPTTFFRALDVLAGEGVAFDVALAGSNVRQMPEEFALARERLGARVVHYGRADAEAYAHLLWQSDIVVSTAIHEFFGIAIVEAAYCACLPVLPRRLAYTEVLPSAFHDVCLYDGFEDLVHRLRGALTSAEARRRTASEVARAMARFDWARLASEYDELMDSVLLPASSVV